MEDEARTSQPQLMNELKTFEFDVPLGGDAEMGHVHVLLTCEAFHIETLLKEKYNRGTILRDFWEGICVFSPELDANAGCPTAIIALRSWDYSPGSYAVLAHECLHAAEWMLKQTGHSPPPNWMEIPHEGGPRAACEDAAYLLQRIMRRVLAEA